MNIILSTLVSMLTPWLVWALLRGWSSRSTCISKDSRSFHLRTSLRTIGLLFVPAGPLAVLIMFWLIPPEEVKPGEWPAVLAVSLFMGGLAPIVGFEMWRAACMVGRECIRGWSAWGLPRGLSWQDVRAVHFSPGAQALRFEGNRNSVYVPVLLENWRDFLADVERHAPHLVLPPETRTEPERLAEAWHFQSLYDHADRIVLAGLGAVALTAPFLSLNLTASALAATGGLALALPAVLRRFVARPTHRAGAGLELLQGLGGVIGTIAIIQAFDARTGYLDDSIQSNGWLFLAALAQDIGLAFAVAGLLIWMGKRIWPHRFTPDKTNDPK